jgi:endonuclease/exonuclease/phosphatase family metal-dependent hydrolase
MSDLVLRSPLRKEKYRYVMTNSLDDRGIDVALLYQRDVFKLIQASSIRISFRNNKRTRDILHVTGLLQSNDTLDVFVCHFPSRSGGEKASEGYRGFAARTLRKTTDSLFMCRSNPNVLIMGDFNDCPNNKSIYHALNAREPVAPFNSSALYNLFFDYVNQKKGTYKYRGKWEMLDQIIVSGNMLSEGNSIRIDTGIGKIFSDDFLLEDDSFDSEKKPFRTYIGPKYNNGYSDHLPVFADIVFE